jgi:hypothetical protein
MSEIRVPNILYKYRGYFNDFNRKTLFDQEVYLATMSQFNDPFEGQLPFRYYPEEVTPENIYLKLLETGKALYPHLSKIELEEYAYKRQQENFMEDDNHLEEVQKLYVGSIEEHYGILSLAKSPINYLMWSHYADSHKGFSIGFDTSQIVHSCEGLIRKVAYQDNLPYLHFLDEEEKANDFHSLICTKSAAWKYEDEYRVTKYGGAKSIVKYPKEAIKEIFLGVKMAQTEKVQIIDFVKAEKIDCEIFEISLSKKKFELDSLRIY